MKKQKASSKLFFEEASKKLRRGGYLEEGEVLPSLDDEDEIIVAEEEDENKETRDEVKARIARNIKNRMRSKSRSRVAKKRLYEEDEDEEILINKEIELEDDDMDEDPDYVDDESVVTEEEEDENEEEILGKIAKAITPRSRQRVKNKLAGTRRYKEQFGSIIADNIDFKVLREKLSKVKLSSHESIKRKNSYVSRANKFGAFRLYDGIKLREGKIKFRANGSVESFKVSR
jgi:hypothetical protein